MKITKKNLPKSEVELKIEVSEEELKKYRSKVIKSLSNELKIDGFRKGHIPENVLIQKIGENAILSETLEMTVRECFTEAVKIEKVYAIDTPRIAIDQQKPLIFTATVSVFPEVKVPEISKITVPKKKVIKVDNKEIDETKNKLMEKFIELKKVDRKSKKGDLVEIDFEGFSEDGVSLDGTQSKHHPVVIGSNTFIPGFEDEIKNLQAEEEKEFNINFPKDYHKQSFQNKKVKFKIKVHNVFERIMPNFDEKLAEKITGQKKTAKELEEEIIKSLEMKYEQEENTRRENEFLDNLIKNVDIEIPAILIEKEIDEMIDNMKENLAKVKITWEKHLENLKTNEEDIRKTIQKEAVNNVKKRLAFSKLLEENKPEVAEKEIEIEIAKIVATLPNDEKKHAQKHFAKNSEGWQRIAQNITINKFFDELLKN